MKSLPVMTIVAIALASISALVIFDVANLLLAVAAIVFGIVMMVTTQDTPGFASGAVSIILGLVGALFLVGSIGGEDGEVSFGGSPALGHALVIIAMVATTACLIWMEFDDMEMWAKAIGIASIALVVILALVFSGDLADQSKMGGFLVAFAAALGLAAPIERLRA